MRFDADASITDARYGLEDNPVDINLGFAESEINGDAVPVGSLPDIARISAAELAGLVGKVMPPVVWGLLGASGLPIQGLQRSAQIEVNPAAPDARRQRLDGGQATVKP